MRITEEQERRRREAEILERLPRALEDMHRALAACIQSYQRGFGAESAEMHMRGGKIEIVVREKHGSGWQPRDKAALAMVPELPGFRIEHGEEALLIEVGLLPGDKVFYRTGDQYLTMEELTRRILDRALFPKLKQE